MTELTAAESHKIYLYRQAMEKIRAQFDREFLRRIDTLIIVGHDIEAQAVYQMMYPEWTPIQCRQAVEDRALYIGVRALKLSGDAITRKNAR